MDSNTQHILIAGGNGFLGQCLYEYFTEKGKKVRLLVRNPKFSHEILWDGKHFGEWTSQIEWADVLINLAGKSVDCRYTEKNKVAILSSRIDSTRVLCEAIQKAENPPSVWINSSSATTYVHSESQQMTEDEGIIGDDFSMNVCKQWEATFFQCQLNHTRCVATRTSIVIGRTGGAYPMLRRITAMFLGGRQGNGNQFFSWIAVQDFCRAMQFIIEHPELVGPINVTAPNPIRNKDLMKLIRKKMGIPFGIPQPKWILELGARLIGTETELLLKSRNVIPEKLEEAGFKFECSHIANSL